MSLVIFTKAIDQSLRAGFWRVLFCWPRGYGLWGQAEGATSELALGSRGPIAARVSFCFPLVSACGPYATPPTGGVGQESPGPGAHKYWAMGFVVKQRRTARTAKLERWK